MKTTKNLSLMRRIGIGVALVAAGAGIGAGCRDMSTDFREEGTYNGYATIVGQDGEGRKICISEVNDPAKRISARDYDKDGRFDEIRIHVPKGNPLENLATLDKLEDVWGKVAHNAYPK